MPSLVRIPTTLCPAYRTSSKEEELQTHISDFHDHNNSNTPAVRDCKSFVHNTATNEHNDMAIMASSHLLAAESLEVRCAGSFMKQDTPCFPTNARLGTEITGLAHQPRQKLKNAYGNETSIPSLDMFMSSATLTRNADELLEKSNAHLPNNTSTRVVGTAAPASRDSYPNRRNEQAMIYPKATSFQDTNIANSTNGRACYTYNRHENYYSILGTMASQQLAPQQQWAAKRLLQLHQGGPHHPNHPSQFLNTSGYLPCHSLDSSPYTFVVRQGEQPPNLQQPGRTRNEMPMISYQEQERVQSEEELRRIIHTDAQSYSPPRQQHRLEHYLPHPSQPQEPLPLVYRLNHDEKRGRKGICFEERLSSLIEFKSEYGHCNVPTCTRKKDQLNKYYTLGLWCGNVRKAYKRMQANKKPAMRLTDEYIQRLNDVGFRWHRKGAARYRCDSEM